MDLLTALKVSSSGLAANRTKMNVIATNLANAETTRTDEGGPYKRKMVVFEAKPIDGRIKSQENCFNKCFRSCGEEIEYTCSVADRVDVTKIVESQEDFRLVYNPSHPDADPITGYVKKPNVNHLTEMADMIVARRSYDANVTAITNTKSMILKALEIGK